MIALEDGRLLFSALSHVEDRLILVGMHYFDRPIDYERVRVRIPALGEEPVRLNAFIRKDYEPCVVLSAAIGQRPVTIEISYEGKIWVVPLEEQSKPASEWTLMTLFKHDHRLLPEFLRYYSALGVAQFHLYYNGPLESVDWTFLLSSEAGQYADIILYEWDVPYWWRLSGPVTVPVYTKQGFQHCAQPMAMNHHLHLKKAASGYTFFVDLDEFIFTPKPVLERYCRTGTPGVLFQCWFAVPEGGASYERFTLTEDMPLLVSERGCGSTRMKCLINTLDVDLMGVHFPTLHADKEFAFVDGHFHIGFDENLRSEQIPKNFVRTTKSQFVRARCGDLR